VFHDRARIHVQAGRGGDGGLSFRREKHVPKGGPDGGDGGHGGEVALVVDPDLRDLSAYRNGQRFRARSGEAGGGSGRYGAAGGALELRVPTGTQVLDEDGQLLADLVAPGARVVLAKGGTAGRGNRRFATAVHQTPRFAEVGLPGEERWLTLQLKLMADAALVGLPNAGKSSLISRLSNARPKVAEYAFTTLAPVLGTLESEDGRQLIVADVPGLIEGASEGVGLGYEFLAHLERARLLVHVIDAAAGGSEARFREIDRELEAYGGGLEARDQVIVLNKIDLLGEIAAVEVEDARIRGVFQISCATGEGIQELKRALFDLCPAQTARVEADGLADFLVYRPRTAGRRFRILRTEAGFRVLGEVPDDEELERVLRAAGARSGQLVEVGEDVRELG